LVNDAAKFQRLYELIEKEHLRYLDIFDESIWSQIQRGDLLEIQAKIRTPEFFKLTQVFDAISPLVDVVKAVDESFVDAKTDAVMKGFGGLTKILEERPLPLLFEAVSTPGYHFVVDLSRQFLRCDISELQGEATVLGKVLRVLAKGQVHEAFSLVPMTVPNLDKKAQKKLQKDCKSRNLVETVRGPGAVLAALAVYR
jgi:hypothetical protein